MDMEDRFEASYESYLAEYEEDDTIVVGSKEWLEDMFRTARRRVHNVYYHQLNELEDSTYSALIRNHRALLARLKEIKLDAAY
tara:strand:+ start:86 stop:334 length:249 start_codon:yes stop_codon:yes gene_type:complete